MRTGHVHDAEEYVGRPPPNRVVPSPASIVPTETGVSRLLDVDSHTASRGANPLVQARLLALQSQAGNRAVSQLVQRRPAAGKVAGGRPVHVQRRFGMEIELPGVMLTSVQEVAEDYGPMKKGEKVVDAEPAYNPSQPLLGLSSSGHYLLHADHSDTAGGVVPEFRGKKVERWKSPKGPKGSILELVTKPIDEFKESDQAITSRLNSMASFARAAAAGSGKKLSSIRGAQVSEYNYVGFPNIPVVNPPLRAPTAHPNGSIQATYGVKLDRLPDLLDLQSDPKGAPAPATAAAPQRASGGPPPPLAPPPLKAAPAGDATQQVLAEARQKGGTVTRQLLLRYGSRASFIESPEGRHRLSFADEAALAQVQGLNTLLLNYLLAGTRDMGAGWSKNRVGQLFYKSRLSEVRNTIHGRQGKLLSTQTKTVADMILAASGRSGADYVIKPRDTVSIYKGMPTCATWVTSALKGEDDKVFDSLKNSYGQEIKPEKIGPRHARDVAVIMENRRLGKLVQPKVSSLKAALDAPGTKPEDWAGMAVKLAQMLRIINGKGAPDLDNIRALLKS